MRDERHRRLVEVFSSVRELPEEERRALLERLGNEDGGLRARVEALLKRDLEGTDFLERPALGSQLSKVLPLLTVPSAEADSGLAPRELPPELPTSIAGYRLLEVLGEGAMGTVFLAEQTRPDRPVALKLVRPGWAGKKLLQRFEHEADVLGRLQHPGIAQIFEAGTFEWDGASRPYFVMEYVEGQDLLTHAREQGLGSRDRLGLLGKVCDAIHHAHQKGVIHRDLKPDNILVTSAGQPKVLDFGVARVTDSDVQLTTVATDLGQIIGTIPYMSPEQASGDSAALDIRSDVYALGVIGFELLVGQLPYDLQDKGITDAILLIQSQEPTRLGSLERRLRGDVETIIAKALEKERERRYQSAAELAADVQHYLRNEPIVARPRSAWVELRKWVQRNRGTAGAIIAAFTLTLVGAAVVLIVQHRWTSRSELSSYVAHLEAAAAALDVHDVDVARRHLEEAPAGRRDWEWRHLWHRLDQSELTWQAHRAWTSDVDYSPDGRLLVSGGRDGRVRLWDASSGELLRDLTSSTATVTVHSVRFSPEGRVVAAAFDDGSIRRWDLETHSPLPVLERGPQAVNAIAFHPHRPILLSAGDDHLVDVWSLNEDRLLTSWTGHDQTVLALAFSSDGRRAASGSSDHQVIVRDVQTGEEVVRLGHPAKIQSIDFSSDGSFLVTAGKQLHVWSVPEGRQLAFWRGRECGEIWFADLHPDDRRILVTGRDGSLRVWDWTTDTMVSQVHGHLGEVGRSTWHPSGREYASAGLDDGCIKIWSASVNGDVLSWAAREHWIHSAELFDGGSKLLAGHYGGQRSNLEVWRVVSREPCDEWMVEEGIERAVLSTDESRVAIALTKSREARILDLETWEETGRFGPFRGRCTAVAFGPDDRLLATGSSLGIVEVWNIAREERLTRFEVHDGWINDLLFGRDGSWVASAGEGGDVVVSRMGGESRRLQGHDEGVMRLALHPDGEMLASASKDWTIRLWDVGSASEIAVLEGHTQEVYSVAFHPAGTRLASGSEDCTIKLWDLDSKRCVTTLRGEHEWRILDLDFSDDGDRLVSATRDGELALWDTESAPRR